VAEPVTGYPRWQGGLQGGTRAWTIVATEFRKVYDDTWGRTAIFLALAYTALTLGSLYTTAQQAADESTVHTMDAFVSFLNLVRWGALAVVAVAAGPSLLEDRRKGALELYFSRSVTRADYLLGKLGAVFLLALFVMFVPALIYYGATFVFFDTKPDGWGTALPNALLYAVMWAALVSGLGLGLSTLMKSSRGASLVLFGGFATLDIVLSELFEGITRRGVFEILSPFSALAKQAEWLFGIEVVGADFPAWWGLVEWVLLTVVGWALVAWRYPRVAGEGR
jgi:ABC-type transport system involved in multi-copper enzyme maturation permease subunit